MGNGKRTKSANLILYIVMMLQLLSGISRFFKGNEGADYSNNHKIILQLVQSSSLQLRYLFRHGQKIISRAQQISSSQNL